jgi:dihydrolipoamide dehydrogenase
MQVHVHDDGPKEEQAIAVTEKKGFALRKSQGNSCANSKAITECEGNGKATVLFNMENGKLIGVHILGLHAADYLQQMANAVSAITAVKG